MMYVPYPLSLRHVEDLLAERGIEVSDETVRFWWNRFGQMFAAEIRSTVASTAAETRPETIAALPKSLPTGADRRPSEGPFAGARAYAGVEPDAAARGRLRQ